MGWLSGWAYRKQITITGSTGAGTNYQVLLKVGESSGASGYNFHLGENSASFPTDKNDGGDLRFTDDDETTLLDFWVEKIEGTSPNRTAYIWVEVADDLGSNQNIYCYYGNSGASNASNIGNTFLLGDDFEGDSLDTGKWDAVGTGSVSVASSVVNIYGTAQESIYSKAASYGDDTALEIKWMGTSPLNDSTYPGFGYGDKQSGNGIIGDNRTADGMGVAKFHAAQDYVKGRNSVTSSFVETDLSESTDWDAIYKRYSIKRTSSKITYVDGGTGYDQSTDISTSDLYAGIGEYYSSGATCHSKADWIVIRKYIDSEPTYNSADEEEVSPGWLSGWSNRIKLTIDHSKVDADLSHFPVTVILSSIHGNCVFDELTSDANRLKIAFTKSDGTTQLYGEIEKWDDANESAIIHVSASGWSISSSVDTDFYMYYDVDHADNSTYIGNIDSTPAQSVWDTNFKMVQHMVDATTSTVKDSTSNNNDGTKKAANEPIEAVGKVGKAQDFDYSNLEYILCGEDDSLVISGDLTLEAIFCPDADFSAYPGLVGKYGPRATYNGYSLVGRDGKVCFEIGKGGGARDYTCAANNAVIQDTWYYAAGRRSSNVQTLYIDSALQTATSTAVMAAPTVPAHIGSYYGEYLTNYMMGGIIDEVRISNIARSAAWIKATYNTLWDTLLTYGSKETSGNAIFFGCNF